MFDELKRLVVLGAGALSLAEEEVSATIATIREKEALSKDEGEKMLVAWRDRVAANRREVEALAAKAVQDALSSVGVPARHDLDALAARVEALELRVDMLEGKRLSE